MWGARTYLLTAAVGRGGGPLRECVKGCWWWRGERTHSSWTTSAERRARGLCSARLSCSRTSPPWKEEETIRSRARSCASTGKWCSSKCSRKMPVRAWGGRAGGAGAGVQGSGGAVREAPVSRARDETIASLRSSGSTRTSYHRSASVSCMRFRRLSCARQMRSDSAGVSRTVCSTSAARSGDTPTWRPRDASRQTSSTKTSAVKAWSSSETPCKLT